LVSGAQGRAPDIALLPIDCCWPYAGRDCSGVIFLSVRRLFIGRIRLGNTLRSADPGDGRCSRRGRFNAGWKAICSRQWRFAQSGYRHPTAWRAASVACCSGRPSRPPASRHRCRRADRLARVASIPQEAPRPTSTLERYWNATSDTRTLHIRSTSNSSSPGTPTAPQRSRSVWIIYSESEAWRNPARGW